jgi:hypothetical protein
MITLTFVVDKGKLHNKRHFQFAMDDSNVFKRLPGTTSSLPCGITNLSLLRLAYTLLVFCQSRGPS